MGFGSRGACMVVGMFFASSAFAQVDTGAITGRVTDSSGAAVPNVQINIVQTETNFRFQTVTNGEGIYRVQSLQPGTYRVDIRSARV